MEKIIVCENIRKTFGEGEEKCLALNGVSLQIAQGEFVAVMGPSGSGKSTLMYALSGMDRIDGGRVSFRGVDLSSLKEKEHARILRNEMGFIFQQPTLLKNLNILDNIILPSMRDNRKNNRELRDRAMALMKKVGIDGLERRDITQVSGGQLQRAGICRALMNNPKVIFGDEPTGALNSKSAHEIMDIFSMINEEGPAVVLVTHDAKVAARTERLLYMRDGSIASEMQFPRYRESEMKDRVRAVSEKMREIGI